MSVEKNMNTRIQHKHDTEANWNKAINFIPRIGEIIVYDIDENHNYSRLKIGDGIRTINNLEFSQTDSDILDANGILKNSVLPEGFPYVSKGVVVPESIITVDRTLFDAPCGPIMDQFTLAAGDSYTVNYNGVEYQCIAKTIIVQNTELVTIGNSGPIDGSEPTNEPFLIVDVPESMVAGFGCQGIAAILDGSSQIILSITGNTIQKMSKELLPNIGVSNIVDGIGIASVRSVAANPELGNSSFAFGSNAKASGHFSHAEGKNTVASGETSHAEGNNTVASGQTSHAEGDHTTASGDYSHAEGGSTIAFGSHSHAEGSHSHAEGWGSHAEGSHSHALGECQHVQGKYNIADTTNAFIIGNGDSDTRSNANTVDWNGNAWFAGDVYVGSTSGKNKDEGSKKLVTEAELASLIAQITEAVSQKSQVQLITWEDDD